VVLGGGLSGLGLQLAHASAEEVLVSLGLGEVALEELTHLALRAAHVTGLLLLSQGTGVLQLLGGKLLIELVIELARLAQLLLERLALQTPGILGATLGLLGTIALEDEAIKLSLKLLDALGHPTLFLGTGSEELVALSSELRHHALKTTHLVGKRGVVDEGIGLV